MKHGLPCHSHVRVTRLNNGKIHTEHAIVIEFNQERGFRVRLRDGTSRWFHVSEVKKA